MAHVPGVTIVDKERVRNGASERYLIFTEGETFKNSDTIWGWKFNSSDLYGRLREGQTCDLTVTGWRLPFFSSYRNILKADCNVTTIPATRSK